VLRQNQPHDDVRGRREAQRSPGRAKIFILPDLLHRQPLSAPNHPLYEKSEQVIP
jgi:hypothetical protein